MSNESAGREVSSIDVPQADSLALVRSVIAEVARGIQATSTLASKIGIRTRLTAATEPDHSEAELDIPQQIRTNPRRCSCRSSPCQSRSTTWR